MFVPIFIPPMGGGLRPRDYGEACLWGVLIANFLAFMIFVGFDYLQGADTTFGWKMFWEGIFWPPMLMLNGGLLFVGILGLVLDKDES